MATGYVRASFVVQDDIEDEPETIELPCRILDVKGDFITCKVPLALDNKVLSFRYSDVEYNPKLHGINIRPVSLLPYEENAKCTKCVLSRICPQEGYCACSKYDGKCYFVRVR